MANPKAGLLPLYLELYDNCQNKVRARINQFAETIADEIRARSIDTAMAPVCRVRKEFDNAVSKLEEAGVDAIVTLHLTYSPSLECVHALSATRLPIIVLDTTPACSYGPDQDPSEMMFNHGIHGVQDMCNMLIRKGKPFFIEAGHWKDSDVIDRVAGWLRAAQLASHMRNTKTGIIGSPFKGMGDFAVPSDILKSTVGIETISCSIKEIAALMPNADSPEVKQEISENLQEFNTSCEIDESTHISTVRACIGTRRWIAQNRLDAFTINFGSFSGDRSVRAIPFLEASKSMMNGIGYAGEGDVLTASLVGTLLSVWREATFTEMFCPDWKNETIFVSHMAEFNPNLTDGKAMLINADFGWLGAGSAVIATGRLKPGEAIIVNLAPAPNNTYTLIIAPVQVPCIQCDDRMTNSVRGWMRPQMPIADFLEEFSRLGGTHHSALVYGGNIDTIRRFGDIMGWSIKVMDASTVCRVEN